LKVVAEQKSRCRTFRYRLHPTFRQDQALARQLECQRELYNAALEERIGAWKWERRSVSYFDQCRTLTGLVDVRPDVMASGTRLCRGTLKRLDRAFNAFYARVKSGEQSGFPRFKSGGRYHSLQWEDSSGWKLKIKERRIYLKGIGDVKTNYHRSLAGIPKAITVKREGKKWWLSVRCIEVPRTSLPPTGRDVGIDLGITNLIATSDGDLIVGELFGSRARNRIALNQRKIARQQLGSKRRQRQVDILVALNRKISNQRANEAHRLSRRIVNRYDLIVLENLAIKHMVRAPGAKPDPSDPGQYLANGARAKAGLNRSINDAGWGVLASFLVYKAESAGREVMTVDPRHTSQMCAECAHIEPGNRVRQAEFRCCKCGHEDHADINAARNILRAGRARQALLPCVG
jgi:putative transposase